ncbi:MAG: hypothetical protein Q9M36_06755 [Sulfurovum sp.]|nr:hypothetical protein [Sulfurovum sp.]
MKQMVAKIKTVKEDAQKKLAEVYKENERIAKNIYTHIPKETLKEGAIAFAKELHDSTKSYRWVQYRTSIDSPWTEIHPAYKQAKNWNLSIHSTEVGAVNQKDLQKLSMEVWIETSDGKKKSITGKWEAPAANLTGKPLSIEIASNAMFKPKLLGKNKAFLDASDYFFIKINDTLPKEGKVFDLRGNIYSADSIEGLNSVFATVGKKMGEVTDIFSKSISFKKDVKKTSKHIKKVWVDFIIEKPNTPNKKITRTIFEGDALKKPSDTAMKLLQRWDIHVGTTKNMESYYQSHRSQQLISTITGLKKMHSYLQNNKQSKEGIFNQSLHLLVNPNVVRLQQIRNSFDSFKTEKQHISYISEINLLAIRQGISKAKKDFRIYQISDIMSNQRNSFLKVPDNSLEISQKLSIQHGIWETLTEKSKVSKHKNISYSKSAYEELQKVSNYTNHSINNTSINLHATSDTWWSIDVNTGSTIGMMSLEQGNAGAEFAEYIGVSISVAFTVIGTLACAHGTTADTACCVGVNGNLLVAGLTIGFLAAIFIPSIIALVVIGVAGDLSAATLPDATKFPVLGGSDVPK